MADANPFVVFRRWTVTNTEWTAIVAPWPCNTFVLTEASGKAFNLSSDPTNADAWQEVAAGNGYALNEAPHSLPAQLSPKGVRFNQGDTICYVQALDGTGATVICNYGL